MPRASASRSASTASPRTPAPTTPPPFVSCGEAGDASGWEKQATDFAGGDMLYVWNDHAMTATCVAASSASAASRFNAIHARERRPPRPASVITRAGGGRCD